MKVLKAVFFAAFLNLGALLWAVLRLPDSVPVHIGPNMLIDRYGSRWTIFISGLLPFVFALAVYICMKRYKTPDKNKKVLTVMLASVAIFLIAVTWISVLIAFQYDRPATEPLDIPIDFIIVFPIGVLFIILGNFMGTIKQNPWMGLRVYWTLADETVWKRTHRLSGFTGVAGGFIVCVSALTGFLLKNTIITITGFIIGMLLFILIPTVYSYILYKKLHPRVE